MQEGPKASGSFILYSFLLFLASSGWSLFASAQEVLEAAYQKTEPFVEDHRIFEFIYHVQNGSEKSKHFRNAQFLKVLPAFDKKYSDNDCIEGAEGLHHLVPHALRADGHRVSKFPNIEFIALPEVFKKQTLSDLVSWRFSGRTDDKWVYVKELNTTAVKLFYPLELKSTDVIRLYLPWGVHNLNLEFITSAGKKVIELDRYPVLRREHFGYYEYNVPTTKFFETKLGDEIEFVNLNRIIAHIPNELDFRSMLAGLRILVLNDMPIFSNNVFSSRATGEDKKDELLSWIDQSIVSLPASCKLDVENTLVRLQYVNKVSSSSSLISSANKLLSELDYNQYVEVSELKYFYDQNKTLKKFIQQISKEQVEGRIVVVPQSFFDIFDDPESAYQLIAGGRTVHQRQSILLKNIPSDSFDLSFTNKHRRFLEPILSFSAVGACLPSNKRNALQIHRNCLLNIDGQEVDNSGTGFVSLLPLYDTDNSLKLRNIQGTAAFLFLNHAYERKSEIAEPFILNKSEIAEPFILNVEIEKLKILELLGFFLILIHLSIFKTARVTHYHKTMLQCIVATPVVSLILIAFFAPSGGISAFLEIATILCPVWIWSLTVLVCDYGGKVSSPKTELHFGICVLLLGCSLATFSAGYSKICELFSMMFFVCLLVFLLPHHKNLVERKIS